MQVTVRFKQKTAYEIIAGDWSSDVCSSDLYFNVNIYSSSLLNDERLLSPLAKNGQKYYKYQIDLSLIHIYDFDLSSVDCNQSFRSEL